MESRETLNTDYWNAKGTALGKEGRFEEALLYFDRAIEMEANNAKAWYNKALCLKNLQRYSEALSCFSQAAKLAPDDADIERKRYEVTAILRSRTSPSSGFAAPAHITSKKMYWAVGLICAFVVGLGLWQGGRSPAHPSTGQINQTNTANIADAAPAPVVAQVLPVPHVQLAQLSHNPVSLPNGTVLIRQKGQRGRGKLTVENGTIQDAVVKLVSLASPRKAYCMVYVQANSQVEVIGVREGTYRLLFALGTDWNRRKRSFLQNNSYSKFNDEFVFTETRSEDISSGVNIRYSTWSVTLHAVPTGNARKTDVSEQEFKESD